MALMMGNLYNALRTAGAADEDARKAAEEVADFTRQLSEVRTDLQVVKTMLAAVLAGVVALLIKAFFA